MEYTTYDIDIITVKGVTDLKSEYAFHGNSQGDTSKTNSVELYKNSKGWLSLNELFKDINYNNQEEVDARSLEIKKENDHYINDLKKKNLYKKESKSRLHFHLKHCPKYDQISETAIKTDNYRMTFIDLSNNE